MAIHGFFSIVVYDDVIALSVRQRIPVMCSRQEEGIT